MRIGLICPYSLDVPGGVQQQVLGLADWLHRHGDQVSVLAPGRPRLDRAAGIRLVRFTGTAIPVPWNGSVARIAAGPLTALRVRRWLADFDPEVLHLHEPFTPSAAGLALAWSGARPVLGTFHAFVDQADPQAAVARLAGRVAGRLRNRIRVATAPSPAAAATAHAHWGVEPVIVPNAIEVASYAGEREGGDSPRLTFLGRVDEPRKGLEVLLAALPELRRRLGRFELRLIGPGAPPATPIREPEVHLLGAVDEPTKAALLRRTDVLIAPNTRGESFGLVLVEGLAAGARVVASDLPAFVAVLAGEPAGHTFPVRDPKRLAAAVAAALAGPGPGPADRFDWDRVGHRFRELYAEAAHRSDPPWSG